MFDHTEAATGAAALNAALTLCTHSLSGGMKSRSERSGECVYAGCGDCGARQLFRSGLQCVGGDSSGAVEWGVTERKKERGERQDRNAKAGREMTVRTA